VHEAAGGHTASLAEEVWTNPIQGLLAFLRDPDRPRWCRRAGSAVAGLLPAAAGGAVTRSDLPDALRGALRGNALQPDVAGRILAVTATDDNGLRFAIAADTAQNTPAWTALAVLDDTDAHLDTPAHKQQWRAWLYWSNLIQFLAFGTGDGVQLTTSQIATYPLATLTVCGGIGELQSLVPAAPSEKQDAAAVAAAAAAAPLGSADRRNPEWDEVLPYLTEGQPALEALAEALAQHGAHVAEPGYTLDPAGWMAELAWEEHHIAVVLPGHGADDAEAAKRDAAYTEAGWQVRTVEQWTEDIEGLITILTMKPTGAEGGSTG
jgi:hypothetical protein